jgi:hypothetical protein
MHHGARVTVRHGACLKQPPEREGGTLLTMPERTALNACIARIQDKTATSSDYDMYTELTEIAAGNPAAVNLLAAA